MKVRAAAYSALAAYPMDLLETLEALRPLQQCVQLLVAESDTTAAAEAEVLVGKAIAHEHMRRRRSALPPLLPLMFHPSLCFLCLHFLR